MSRTPKEYKLFETECWDSLADRGADTSRAVSPDLGYDFSSKVVRTQIHKETVYCNRFSRRRKMFRLDIP
jgi:hypothetical protein